MARPAAAARAQRVVPPARLPVRRMPAVRPHAAPVLAMRAMPAPRVDARRVTAAEAPSDWVHHCSQQLGAAMAALKSGSHIEVEVVDARGVLRGLLLCEVIGQTLDSENGLPLTYVSPLASSSDAVLRWAIPNLGAPSAVYLANRPFAEIPGFCADYFVLVVNRWRHRTLATITEAWAQDAVHRLGADMGPPAAGPHDGESFRRSRSPTSPAPERARRAEARPQRDAEAGADLADRGILPPMAPPRLGPGMRAVEALEMELRSEPDLAPPGAPQGGDRGRTPERDDRPRLGERRRAPSLPALDDAFPPEPLGAARRGAGTGGLSARERKFVDAVVKLARRAKDREEDPMWSVRERLSARAGRLHVMRMVKRIAKDLKVEDQLDLPESDDEVVIPKKSKRKRKRGRHDDSSRSGDTKASKRKKKKRSRSSSSSSDSLQLFRGAPSLGAATNRAQRDAQERPHQVLVESLGTVVGGLPRAGGGADMTRGEIFRRLPAVYTSWFDIRLSPMLRGRAGNQRS